MQSCLGLQQLVRICQNLGNIWLASSIFARLDDLKYFSRRSGCRALATESRRGIDGLTHRAANGHSPAYFGIYGHICEFGSSCWLP